MSVEIKGLDRLDRKINQISSRLTESVRQGLEKASKDTATYAISLRRGSKEDGIIAELVDLKQNSVKYRIHTQQDVFPYSWFEHFGTGQYAELPHVGTTKHFIESGFTEWYIPVDKVEKSLRYPIIEINGTRFYIAHGAKPNPFMRKAEFERRPSNLNEVAESIKQMLKEVCA